MTTPTRGRTHEAITFALAILLCACRGGDHPIGDADARAPDTAVPDTSAPEASTPDADAPDESAPDTREPDADAGDVVDTVAAVDAADAADAADVVDAVEADTSEADHAARATFDALTAALPTPLAWPDRAEDTYGTIGTLALGLDPHVVPIVRGPHGALVAATQMGQGRVVAFAGQDFVSSYDRSTLLGTASATQLLANAASWVRHDRTGRVLVDNDAVRAALAGRGVGDVDVVASDGDTRRWSVDLSAYAAIVVQVNEWGTARIAAADLEHVRAYVRAGGGLVIAGSALHWSWWLASDEREFPGDALIGAAGIRWNVDAHLDIASAHATYDPLGAPLALWHAYTSGAAIDDAHAGLVAPLFVSAHERGMDLDVALARLVRDAPALPVAAGDADARMAAAVVATLPPVRWPGTHPWAAPFPGLVAAGAERVQGADAVVDARWVGPVPLGLYAPPGEVVTVTVPEAARARGLQLQVGELHDELDSIATVTTWERAPRMARTFSARADTVEVGSALGGTLYAVLSEGGASDDTFTLTVSGAVRQPWYVAGRTSDAQWADARTLAAPWAVLEVPGKVHLVVRSSAIADEADPAAIMRYWEGFYDSHFALAQEPEPRRRASRFLFDVQVGWGYANATHERIDFPLHAQTWALRRELDSEDIWLFGHELGHQFQTADWTGGDITEVAVNLFTMYTLNGYRNGGGDRETRGFKDNAIDHAALAALRWPSADLFEKLEMYRQLVFAFGWGTYTKVFASYYPQASPGFDAALDGGHLDGFAIRFSRVAERDLTGFFDHWQYPLSDAARARIASFGFAPWLPPGW